MTKPRSVIVIGPDRFHAVWEALAQWADNERNFVDENDPDDPAIAKHAATVAVVESVVAEMEAQINDNDEVTP